MRPGDFRVSTIARQGLAGLYWLLWYGLVPLLIVDGVVTLLLKPAPAPSEMLLRQWARSQPIPMSIALYLVLTSAASFVRYRLPFAAYAFRAKLGEVPLESAAMFERAQALVDEFADFQKKVARLRNRVPEHSGNEVDNVFAELRRAMVYTPFQAAELFAALVRAEEAFGRVYGRWRKGELRATLEVIAPIVLALVVLRGSVADPFKIPSGSMIPTLQVGDHIFVNKLKYGPAIPFTQTRLWENFPPDRGVVAVFAYPEEPAKDFVKRVIGLPGDTIEVKGGHPWINGWEVPSCLVGFYSHADSEGDLYVEYLGNQTYFTLYAAGAGAGDQGPFIVKPSEAFVMGDNRHNSHDSRFWWDGKGGGVPFANFTGPASLIWFSYAGSRVDWSRIGGFVMPERLSVPPGLASAQPALAKCLRERPVRTKPPRTP
jgi:signal peptidase I